MIKTHTQKRGVNENWKVFWVRVRVRLAIIYANTYRNLKRKLEWKKREQFLIF
jgi:hypothetical protein